MRFSLSLSYRIFFSTFDSFPCRLLRYSILLFSQAVVGFMDFEPNPLTKASVLRIAQVLRTTRNSTELIRKGSPARGLLCRKRVERRDFTSHLRVHPIQNVFLLRYLSFPLNLFKSGLLINNTGQYRSAGITTSESLPPCFRFFRILNLHFRFSLFPWIKEFDEWCKAANSATFIVCSASDGFRIRLRMQMTLGNDPLQVSLFLQTGFEISHTAVKAENRQNEFDRDFGDHGGEHGFRTDDNHEICRRIEQPVHVSRKEEGMKPVHKPVKSMKYQKAKRSVRPADRRRPV